MKKPLKPPKVDYERVKRLDELRKRIAEMPSRLREAPVEDVEVGDGKLPPNWPKGMRAINYNAMREAMVMDEAVRCGASQTDDNTYTEPVVPFHIDPSKVPVDKFDRNASRKFNHNASHQKKGKKVGKTAA